MATFDIIQDELSSIIKVAQSTALNDDKITSDEVSLLDMLNNQLGSIENDLRKISSSLPNDLSESEIRYRVQLLAKDLIPKLTTKAREDGQITSDERAILDNLMEKIL